MRIYNLILLLMLPLVGLGQYQFLGTYNDQGVPDYLESRETIPPGLLADIEASLPEGKPVPTYNPHYISSGYDTDIHLIDSAEVYVTFVGEGAGYKNVLGFYTYDLDDPYVSAPSTNEITIIFPNVSADGSGGGLIPGDRVKLGNFPPNTGIGWVLMADGWKGSAVGVTDGNWVLYSNPNFNPEPNESDRFHNVLLKNMEEELIVLGFEDIRRDYSNCDQDFNDALFYVSANPFTAISSENFVELTDSESFVTSGNDGGLESEGSMASLIARRNLNRSKRFDLPNKMKFQPALKDITSRSKNQLVKYVPQSGFFNKEKSYQSTPEDLISITNATSIFSADYYLFEKRVAATMVIESEEGVYNHSKNICDRFNGGKIKDIRYVHLNGYQFVFASIQQASGETEFATWFSLLESTSSYKIMSLWNIDDYPSGSYLNFQIWGTSPSQLFHQVNHILQILKQDKPLQQYSELHLLPNTFASRGYYESGVLALDIVNRNHDNLVTITGFIRSTEFAEPVQMEQTIPLTGASEETIYIETGQLFDFGFSIYSNNSPSRDVLYLADGSWGVDYDNASINFVEVKNNDNYVFEPNLLVERNIEISGINDGVVNVFRHFSPTQSMHPYHEYNSIIMEIQNDIPIELVLLGKDMEWKDRFITTIGTNYSLQEIQIDLNQFKSASGKKIDFPSHIQSLIFSHLNKSGTPDRFTTSINNIRFSRENVILNADGSVQEKNLHIYPNPSHGSFAIQLERDSEILVEIIDLFGKSVFYERLSTTGKKAHMHIDPVPGLYQVIIIQDGIKTVKRLVIN